MTMILLVDDDPAIRELMTTFLLDEGFEVSAYDRAELALARLAIEMADLLILDGRLPGMSGWQCLDRLRAAEPTTRLPIVMLTAALDDLEKATRPPDECTTYLTKPFDLDAVLAAISAVIRTCNEQPLTV